MDKQYEIEEHPWQPWLPPKAKVLIMGTFPPGKRRWSMNFYYPNPINDFWRIIGLIFLGDKDALYLKEQKIFSLKDIKALTSEKGIAMSDTVKKARRLKGNASDKFLEVVESNDPIELLKKLPLCSDIATTGEKAAAVVAEITSTPPPAMGKYVEWDSPLGRRIRIWRMPSTSRAYPLALDKKAAFYQNLFEASKIL